MESMVLFLQAWTDIFKNLFTTTTEKTKLLNDEKANHDMSMQSIAMMQTQLDNHAMLIAQRNDELLQT